MTINPEQRLQALRRRIKNGERGGRAANREVLLEFSEQLFLLRSEYSDHRHSKLLRHLTKISEETNESLRDILVSREVVERIVTWINQVYDNPETNRDYRVAVRVFAKRLTDSDKLPDSVKWVPASTPSSYDPSPDPAEMLRWDSDVKPMIDAAVNHRDAALVAVAFDSGARSGELQAVRVGDVSESEYGLRLRVNGKTGERSVTLVPSEHYVSQWLGSHPASTDPSVPLWSKLGSPEPLSYRRFLDLFEALADRANVEKPVTPTNFRKSNASWLARQGANAALIEDRQGRARNSKAVARYVSRFGRDDESRQYAALHGIEVAETGDEQLAPLECRRCEKESPHDEPMCVWCGAAMDVVSAETADRVKDSLQTGMARSDDAGERMALLRTLRELDSNPELATELVREAISDHSETSSS